MAGEISRRRRRGEKADEEQEGSEEDWKSERVGGRRTE